jgi:hypothetical protein
MPLGHGSRDIGGDVRGGLIGYARRIIDALNFPTLFKRYPVSGDHSLVEGESGGSEQYHSMDSLIA